MAGRCHLTPLRSIPAGARAAVRAAAAASLLASLALATPSGAVAQTSATIEDLGWIAGHWVGEAFGGTIEEGWFAPAGGGMSGSFRLVVADTARMYELLLLETDPDGSIHYRFKHVMPGWVPREETRLDYRLTGIEGRKATFRSTAEEPVSGAPWWFTYESPSPDRLVVTIHGATGGEPIVLSMARM